MELEREEEKEEEEEQDEITVLRKVENILVWKHLTTSNHKFRSQNQSFTRR